MSGETPIVRDSRIYIEPWKVRVVGYEKGGGSSRGVVVVRYAFYFILFSLLLSLSLSFQVDLHMI